MAMTKCKECGNEVSDKADACPKCGAKVAKKPGLLVKIGGGFVALIFLLVIFSPAPAENKSTQQAAAAAPELKTTAREIAVAYNENTVAADNKFKGKRFEVNGTIADIRTDFMDNAVINLKGGVNEFMEPQFKLAEAEKPKAATLKKGLKVTMSCEGAGDIAKTPMMDDCTIK